MPHTIANLQVLRGVAALGVVFYHMSFMLPGEWHTEFFGVSTFFVISGFIMCYITRDDADGFLKKRLQRIVPIYWIVTIAHLLLTAKIPVGLVRGTVPMDILWSFLFLPTSEFPVLSVGWTLNSEVYFYFVFAAALLVNRKLAPLIAAAFLFCILRLDSAGYGGFITHYYSNPYIKYFIAGIAVYYTWTFLHPFVPRWPTIIICTGVVCIFYGSQFFKPWWPSWFYPALDFAAVAIVPSALFLESSGASITWKPLLLLGDASYAIYLTHLTYLREVHFKPVPSFYLLVPYILGAAIVGILTHLYVEKPVLRRIRRGSDRQSMSASNSSRADVTPVNDTHRQEKR
jgi:exopolysaccharide production protein ExoZ